MSCHFEKIDLKIFPLDNFRKGDLPLPSYETAGSVGMDVRACLGKEGDVLIIHPGERKKIPTGLAIEIPMGYEIQVRPRSGISLKTDLLMVNSPGTIDNDYRNEVHVIMGNIGKDPFTICHGDRIAQWVMAPIIRANLVVVTELSSTARGMGGFGSTGGVKNLSNNAFYSSDGNLGINYFI